MIPLVDRPTDTEISHPFCMLRGAAWGLGATVTIAVLTVLAQTAIVPDRIPQRVPFDPLPGAGFVPSASVAARPAVPIVVSGPRFRLDDVDPVNPARSEPPRLNPSTGQREDTLVQGEFGLIEGPYLRLTIAEGSGSSPSRSLFVTLARRGADGLGLAVLKTGERGRLKTKFGSLDTLDVTLGGPITRTCTGFMTSDASPVRLDGWLCAPLGQPPEPRAVACALDKLVLNGQASGAFETLVRAAETRRDRGCGSAAMAPSRDITGQTGSIDKPRQRKNKAELRRSAQAQP